MSVLSASLGMGLFHHAAHAQGVDLPPPSLARALARHFHFGAAVTPGQVSITAPDFIRHQFNIVVAENAMKPDALARQGEGRFDFSAADTIVDFAVANGMKVRGHTLVWHQQMPSWMFIEDGREVTRATLITRIENYITAVVTHFKGRVFAWDVVNEAFAAGEPGAPVDDRGMRMSTLRRVIGPEFIEIAFRAAAKADPDALLFYNDYETQQPKKIEAISRMVTDFKARDVKIDGIGHQAHCAMGHPSLASLEAAIDAYAALGVTQHITELDIALNNSITGQQVSAATPELLQRQADRYADFFRLFIAKRKAISAVLTWGIGDASSWLKYWPQRRFEAPLLFDEQLLPKPAYFAVLGVANAS